MSKTGKIPRGAVAVIPTGWRNVVFICRKCSKKLDGGFGADGTQSLRGALRDGLRARGRRGEVGLIEVGCLGVCPKGAVTVGLASAPGELLVVGRGADAGAVLDRGGRA
jgi:predicted metal-binding protein